MTIKEIISALQKLPDDMEVMTYKAGKKKAKAIIGIGKAICKGEDGKEKIAVVVFE